MSEAQRFPLSWPTGWVRTPYHQRRRAAFYATKTAYGSVRPDGTRSSWKQKESLSVGDGLERLDGELGRLGAFGVVISSNLRVRQDGMPYSQQAKNLDDPGVAVYFRLKNQPRVLACDKWLSAAENMAAIAGHINAIRAVDRYGVGSLEQAFAGYAALPSNTAANWRDVFGFKADERVTWDQVSDRFREMARTAHPDAGGTDLEMARLSESKSFAKLELAR